MSAILSASGITAVMSFYCCDCGGRTSGQEIIDGERIYIVKANREEPHRSVWRCQNCQDDFEDYQRD
jgi:hypothetical protein